MMERGRNLARRRERLDVDVKATEPVRLDHYLLSSLVWKSRSRLQGLIRDGHITVNGERVKPSRRVRAGDVISLQLSCGAGIPDDYDDRPLELLYEDDWLLAVNKPPGMLSHPVGRHVYDTLINYLHHRYHLPPGDDGGRSPRLCHRLDRDTTGVVLVARDSYVHREVMYQFENRLVSKEYLALVEGRLSGDERRIDLAIGEGRSLATSLDHPVLKASATVVRVERHYRDYTLVRCVPHTGRQNQIRIHLAARGHPLVGDERFGGLPPAAGFPPRYLLHSESLRLYHPRLKSALEIRAPLPEDFRQLLEGLSPETPSADNSRA
jgi:23S rRNA pseudouridine1911/1915/1917 synthase